MDEIEIPEAIRENVELPKKSRLTLSIPLIVGLILGVAVVGILLFSLLPIFKPTETVVTQPTTKSKSSTPEPAAKPNQNDGLDVSQSPQQKPTTDNSSPNSDTEQLDRENLLGHLAYDVVPESELVAITSDGSIKMRSAAANKFQQMQAAARAEGIVLTPISAFRTIEAQNQLFFGVKEQKVEDAAKRAEVSAPPGYSEHHTGYAIDIGDGNAPGTNVEVTFAETAAFAWLKQNALKYSFELSFPPDNEQGVSYEPWHWRFVGDRDSLETFYKVRN